MTRLRDEEGSTLLITIFYAFVGLSVILVVVAATSLYLERKRLFTLADGAALAAAESFDLDEISIDGDSLEVELTSDRVARATTEHLAIAATPDDAVEIVAATTPDGRSAVVTLRSVWRPPVAGELLPIEIPVTVTSTARSVFG